MAIKKSELYSSLWKSCDEIRASGGMDASQYKDYVLTLLFVKYVSDKAEKNDSLIQIPSGGSFADLVALKGDKEIGDKINIAIKKLAEANDLRGVIDVADFNDEDKLGKGKDMQDCLSKLVSIFDDLDFRNNSAEGDDLLGDAYEYLMRHFATESGKSKGQFYTPAEVSRIISKVIGIDKDTKQDQTVYDPTCGSGSLLLKAADEAPNSLTIYGQEKDLATTALAKMNMILHDQASAVHDIKKGNSLTEPAHIENNKLKTFDFVVANPPFSVKAWQNGFSKDESNKTINDPYSRFEHGTPPAKNGDYAFLLHILKSLKSGGKGAVILPHGVLFRGNAESLIRKQIVKQGYIKGIIGLPANLFYGTGIPACIIVLDKKHANSSKGIFMINASNGFIKDGNKNRLRSQDIHKIVDVFSKNIEIDGYSRMVPISEISDPKNDYNLNLPRYIYNKEDEDIHDLIAHLKGGIPKTDIDNLTKYWNVFPNIRQILFEEKSDKNYLIFKLENHHIKDTILDSLKYKNYKLEIQLILKKWIKKYESYLQNINQEFRPKDIIFKISESLLLAFNDAKLIDKYDIYQHLMDYWSEIMQDDIYQITGDGWQKAAQIRLIIDDKNKKNKETPDIVIGPNKNPKKFKAELIPPPLIINNFYKKEHNEIIDLENKKESITAEIEDLITENSGEEDLLEEVKNDKGKITKTNLTTRIKKIKNDPDFDDEIKILLKVQDLINQEGELSVKIKNSQTDLDKKIVAHYSKLSLDEIKQLVICDKWFAKISADIETEIEKTVQNLTSRLKELENRYKDPMPKLAQNVSNATAKVEKHLKNMGLDWS